MNKKYIITGITGLFLIVSGICYSCAFQKDNTPEILSQTKQGSANSEKQSGDNQIIGKDSTAGKDSSKDVISEKQTSLSDNAKEGHITEIPQPEKDKTEDIYVHICGAVVNPGVYKANAGDRIFDLIKMSGGLSGDAAGDYINQAVEATDGQRVYIPTKEEIKDLTPAEYMGDGQTISKDTDEKSDLININTANAETLMKLPGIGQAKAASIIEYRTANGSFQAIEELMQISGIKEGLFQRISSRITIE
jgi:competence protein ComEA helix-hairpin-helix repeat region